MVWKKSKGSGKYSFILNYKQDFCKKSSHNFAEFEIAQNIFVSSPFLRSSCRMEDSQDPEGGILGFLAGGKERHRTQGMEQHLQVDTEHLP